MIKIEDGLYERFLELPWYNKIGSMVGILLLIPALVIIISIIGLAKCFQWASYVLFDDY